MKKIPLIILILTLLCGCSAKEPEVSTPETNRLFSAEAVFCSGETEISATIRRLGNDMWTAQITAPESLAGITLNYSSDEITATYHGMSFTLDKENAPKANILGAIFDAIDSSAILTEMPCDSDGENITFTGENHLGGYEIVTDSEGNLVGVNISDEDISVDFTEFTAIT